VGGIPLTISEKEFREYFEAFGKVTEVLIMKDKLTGHPRGFGFVSFEDEDCIDIVLSETHELFGKKVEVKKAEPKKQKFETTSTKPVFNTVQPYVYPVQYYYNGNSYTPQFVPQNNEYEYYNKFYYNVPSGYPYSPPLSPQPFELENGYDEGSNLQFHQESKVEMQPLNQSRIVGSHRYRSEKFPVIGDMKYMGSSSLFLDTPQNNIINNPGKENNDMSRHSWSGFKSDTELLEHSQLEDTFHRHSWSGW